MEQSLHDLLYGFSVALQPQNIGWSFFGVLVGNLIGVLPGMGALSAMSMLLPLTHTMQPVPAILMLAGIFYGSQYGGAIGAILLNIPSHAAHAVTCIDGYPMTKQGKGGTALGVAMMSSFFAASFGITVMIVASPLLVRMAYKFGPTEIAAIMLFGLLAGGTMSGKSPLKGVAMTILGMLVGIVGMDINSGTERFTFGFMQLSDRVELVALALGLFGIANFLRNVNRIHQVGGGTSLGIRDLRPKREDLRRAFFPMLRGTLVGTFFGAMPGTGPDITTFVAYSTEKRVSKTPQRFGQGALEGVASPEAAAHAKTQVDFIPTMTLGIPGDAVMALILGALLIQGIQPGPQLITDHADIFWGLVASFWIGNIILIVLNMPLIGIWVKLLQIPYRFMVPCALFFICVGVYATNNVLFDLRELIVFGISGAILLALEFPPAPILLGYILGPLIEENGRRALLLSRGDLLVFLQHPISEAFVALCALLIASQIFFALRNARERGSRVSWSHNR